MRSVLASSARMPLISWLSRLASPANVVRFTLVLLVVFGSGGVFQLLGAGRSSVAMNAEELARLNRIPWMVLYPLMAASLFSGWRSLMATLNQHTILVVLALVCLVSVSWSSNPAGSLFAVTQFVIASAFALQAPRVLGYAGFLQTLGWAFAGMIGATLVFMAVLPDYAFVNDTQNAGTLRGIFVEKNVNATFLLFACITFGVLASARTSSNRAFWWACTLVAIIMVLLTRSATALVLLVSTPVFGWLVLSAVRSRSSGMIVLGLAAVGGCAVILVLAIGLGTILEALGKDANLTGRGPLWTAIGASFANNPLFGYGFFGYWNDPQEFGGLRVTNGIGWGPTSTHNAWLNVAVQLGVLGLFLFGAFWVTLVCRSARMVLNQKAILATWPLLLATCLSIWSLVQANFLLHQSMLHLMWLFTAAAATESICEKRRILPKPRQG